MNWYITTVGKRRRFRHQLTEDGASALCGLVTKNTSFEPATSKFPVCLRCLNHPSDPDQVLSTYAISAAGCWIWGGYMDRNGYGRVSIGGRHEWVHRASYRHYKGLIPEGHEIDHVCQTTACMNPEHLDAVTKAEHAARTFRRLGKDEVHLAASHLRRSGLTYAEIADALGMLSKTSAADAVKAAVRKGLIDPSEVPPARRLTDEDRDDIRAMFAFGTPYSLIAEFYRIDASQISRICNGKTSGWVAARDRATGPKAAASEAGAA